LPDLPGFKNLEGLTTDSLYLNDRRFNMNSLTSNTQLAVKMHRKMLLLAAIISSFSTLTYAETGNIYTFYINGIRNDLTAYKSSVTLVNQFLSKTNPAIKPVVDITHNPTGISLGAGDIAESVRQTCLVDPISSFIDDVVQKVFTKDETDNHTAACGAPKAKFLIIAHSQGTFFAENVADELRRRYPDIAARTRILAISPFTDFKKKTLLNPLQGRTGTNFQLMTPGSQLKTGSVGYQYLLRSDDFPTKLKALPCIAIPTDKSNLSPLTAAGNKTLDSHNLAHYLDNPNDNNDGYVTPSAYKVAVNQAFKLAQANVKSLLSFNSGTYSCGTNSSTTTPSIFTPPIIVPPTITAPTITSPTITSPIFTPGGTTLPVVTLPILTLPVVTMPVITLPIFTLPF
jgi:hypothetical protein